MTCAPSSQSCGRNRLMVRGGEEAVEAFRDHVKPLTIAALLITVVLLFGFQGSSVACRTPLNNGSYRLTAVPIDIPHV